MVWLLFNSPLLCFSQQESKIIIDSSRKNNITVHQMSHDSSQKSDIGLKHSDSTEIKVVQSRDSSLNRGKSEPTKFIDYVTNTNTIFVLFISIVTFIGLVRKRHSISKKNKMK